MNLQEILAGRKIGVFPVVAAKPPAHRLADILPGYGLSAEQTAQVIGDYLADDTHPDFEFHFRRITKTENDRLRAMANKKPTTRDPKTGAWSAEEIDLDDLVHLRIGYALTQPPFPQGMELPLDTADAAFEEALRKRADYIKDNLSPAEIGQLAAALAEHCSFDLQAAKDRVKN